MKEMNYITKSSDSHRPAAHGEEMEPGTVRKDAEYKSLHFKKAYINGKSASAIRGSAGNITYMADYIADDEGRILAVRYDPVPFGPGQPDSGQ